MINKKIWEKKYKFKTDVTPADTFRRVARAMAETPEQEADFFEEMNSLKFLPGGRILAVAGTGVEQATASNCYVLPSPEDSMSGIMDALKEGALTMKSGGGIGINFSSLRPYNAPVVGTGSVSSGPVSFMDQWNAMSRTISGVGARKGAMIAILNVDHPDIEKFIKAKANNSVATPTLEKFNISVGISDAFMAAVEANTGWPLKFGGKDYGTINAAELFNTIIENNHKKAEPGVVFLDTINKSNSLSYTETIEATNPCGEQSLPAYGACTLGALNLARFIENPFTEAAFFDAETFRVSVRRAIRFLDTTVDNNFYPLPGQKHEATSKRRIGLGIMGLGSALAMIGVKYGSIGGNQAVELVMKILRDEAFIESSLLAKEKGAFPLFDAKKYLTGGFAKTLPADIRADIKKYGIRNSHLLTIAPTGSIAQLAGNVSGGLEPIFCVEFKRRNYGEVSVVRDYAYARYVEKFGEPTKIPDYFVSAHDLTPQQHIDTMSICQKYIDASISKTINLPKEATIEQMKNIYMQAWKMGLKGCTTYREGSLDEEILSKTSPENAEPKPQTVGEKFKRPDVLSGKTYKVKPPDQKHAYYLTFTYYVDSNGKNHAYEFFINTKDPSAEEWTTLITRITSAVFRNVDDPTFLVDEFRDIKSLQTGFWSSIRHKWVPSLAAEFGERMKEFFAEIGIMEPDVPIETYEAEANEHAKENGSQKLAYCKACGQFGGIFEEGCFKCLSCGYNKCG